MSQTRLAPSDARIAISPVRAAPRASNRFAMFTHTISSTSTVTPSSSVSGRAAVAGRLLLPLAPDERDLARAKLLERSCG